MPTELYLDTARLGRMCTSARMAEQDFGRLVSQLGSSLYIERFLTTGFNALPSSLRRDVHHLDVWDGIAGLKSKLRRFVGLPSTYPVLLASRSAHLMTLAAHALVASCGNVMTTDAEWPPFLAILHRVAKRKLRQITVLPLRQLLLECASTPDVAIENLVRGYQTNNCDGVFLSDVTYFGIRLPTREIIARLNKTCRPPAFTVLDGAQVANHVPLQLGSTFCDLYLAGTHKWLQSYLPLSVGFCCTESSQDFISETIARCIRDGHFDDSLFNFCMAAESADFQGFGETVSVAPLITAAAALSESDGASVDGCLADRWRNTDCIRKLICRSPWSVKRPCDGMQTGAMLLQAESRDVRKHDPSNLRWQFHLKHISLSTYTSGLVRLSIPATCLVADDLAIIRRAFAD